MRSREDDTCDHCTDNAAHEDPEPGKLAEPDIREDDGDKGERELEERGIRIRARRRGAYLLNAIYGMVIVSAIHGSVPGSIYSERALLRRSIRAIACKRQ